MSESREAPDAVYTEHTAKWWLFTDEGRKRASKGLYADAVKYLNRALQVTSATVPPVHLLRPPLREDG